MSALVVALFDLAILVVIARRARELLFTWPLDARVAKIAGPRGMPALVVLAREGGASPIASLARAIVDAEPAERAIAIEETAADLRASLTGPLLWLRVMAPAASALGLAGAAVQAAWARHPPGLLALDPDRVLGMAVNAGATCMALGIAGSTTALGALFFLRRRALQMLGDVSRLAERGRTLASDAWTPPGQ